MSTNNWIYLPDAGKYLNIDRADLIQEFDIESSARIVRVTYLNDTYYEYFDRDAEMIIRYVKGLLETGA